MCIYTVDCSLAPRPIVILLIEKLSLDCKLCSSEVMGYKELSLLGWPLAYFTSTSVHPFHLACVLGPDGKVRK